MRIVTVNNKFFTQKSRCCSMPPYPQPRGPAPHRKFISSLCSILLGLLADSGSLAAEDGGSSLHGRALLGLVEGGDAVGDRLEDGSTALLKRHRSRAVAGFVSSCKNQESSERSWL